MTPESLIAELSDRGVAIESAGSELRLDAPAGAMTPDLLEALKSCKGELLKLLDDPVDVAPTPGTALLSRGPGAGSHVSADKPTVPARATPSQSIPRKKRVVDDAKIAAEFKRFSSVCVTIADGSLQDPSEPMLRRGVTGEEWDALLATGARLDARRRERNRKRSRKKEVVKCENELPLLFEAGHTAGK